MARRRLLLVDDDPGSRFALREYFELRGFDVDEADTLRAALASFQASRPDAAVLDHSLPDGTALDLLPRLRALDPGVPLVVLTGHGSIDLAVQAVKEGAEHFFTKPVELATLAVVIERLLDQQRQRQRALAGRSRDARRAVDPFLGTSDAIRRLADEAARIQASDSPVLIQGETGTGKGVLAAWLYQQGPRAEEAFVDLNCATLSKELLESELFGHEKGAFTGAVAAKPGLLEVAHRGTLFLDEVGDMDPLVQPKLLKVLEEQRYRRVGEVRDRQVDVRLIAATHQDLAEAVREKRFRSDLFYRISTIPLGVPPLRERAEDLPLLARELLDRLAGDLGRARIEVGPQALRALSAYSWPGNVRELRNVLERAALLCRDRTIDVGDLRFLGGVAAEPPASAPVGAPTDTRLTLEEVERRHIAAVLEEEGGRVEAAARRLGVPRSSLYKRLRALGLVGGQAVSARVLVVEDEQSIRLAMCEYLEHRGFRVDGASSAAEAEALLGRAAYDVVIADLRLSAADAAGGLRLLRRVRERRPSTRTVLLTAYGSPEVEAEVLRVGVDALLTKARGLEEVAALVGALAAGVPDA